MAYGSYAHPVSELILGGNVLGGELDGLLPEPRAVDLLIIVNKDWKVRRAARERSQVSRFLKSEFLHMDHH